MATLLALLPLLIVIGLLASGRASALVAGLAGLSATLAASITLLTGAGRVWQGVQCRGGHFTR